MIATRRKVFTLLLILFCLVLTGTAGYIFIEDYTFREALFMTIITISTVGFGEVRPLSPAGQIFTVFIIFAGLGTMAYALTTTVAFLMEGELKETLRRIRMKNKLTEIKDHYVLCGAGQTGINVVETFQKNKVPFVVIEQDKQKVDYMQEQGVLVLQGDATHDEILAKARVLQAKGLIACLGTDAANVFVVLTVRSMSPNLHIISRAIDRKAHAKLRKAGADNTISPNEIGGLRMAALLLKPAVVSFLDIITRAGELRLDLEEITITQKSGMSGKTLYELAIPKKIGLMVLAIKKKEEEELHLNPGAKEILSVGDKILVMGKPEQIDVLRKLTKQVTAD